MGRAKDIRVEPISAQDANRIVRQLHYSGKVVNNSQLHLGVFLDGRCGGAMQFGPSLDKRKMQGLVSGTLWNEFIELNRMALADWLPRNGESRAIAQAMRLLRRNAPHLKWVVSFADATQCGDGTIYRASGFVLTGIKVNNQIWEAPGRARESRTSLTDGRSKNQQREAVRLSRVTATKAGNILQTGGASMRSFQEAGFRPIPGFQLRYVYFLDPSARECLNVPVIPFSEIERRGAGMYLGQSRASEASSDAPAIHAGEGGAAPTPTLQFTGKKATRERQETSPDAAAAGTRKPRSKADATKRTGANGQAANGTAPSVGGRKERVAADR